MCSQELQLRHLCCHTQGSHIIDHSTPLGLFCLSLSLISKHILQEIQEKCVKFITQYLAISGQREISILSIEQHDTVPQSAHNLVLQARGHYDPTCWC